MARQPAPGRGGPEALAPLPEASSSEIAGLIVAVGEGGPLDPLPRAGGVDEGAVAVVDPHVGGPLLVGLEVDEVAGEELLTGHLPSDPELVVRLPGDVDAVDLMGPPGKAGTVKPGLWGGPAEAVFFPDLALGRFEYGLTYPGIPAPLPLGDAAAPPDEKEDQEKGKSRRCRLQVDGGRLQNQRSYGDLYIAQKCPLLNPKMPRHGRRL